MKRYFKDKDSEHAYPLKHHIDEMKEEGIKEMTVFEAVMVKDSEYYYCTEHMEVGEKSEKTCGKECKFYNPRNGKNGRCKNNRNHYEWGEEKTIKLKQ